MATITKRGTSYLVRWYDLGGGRRSRTAPTKQAAKDLCRDVEHERALGREWEVREVHAVPTLSAVVEAYLTDRALTRRPQTVTAMGYLLGYAVDWIVSHAKTTEPTLSVLSRALVSAYYASTPELSEGTRQNRARALLDLWRWADDSEEYECHVARFRPIEFRPIEREPTIAPTWAECDAVIGAIGDKYGPGGMLDDSERFSYRAAVVMRFTGLRIGQALGLTWDDVDLTAKTLRVRGELGKSRGERSGRTVPMCEAMALELAGWGKREGLLVGSPWVANIRKLLVLAVDRCVTAKTVRAAAFEGQTCHAFRKAFVTELRRAGVPDDAVEYLVGHSAGVRAYYLDSDALGLRDAVTHVQAIGASRIKVGSTVTPLARKGA